MSFSKNIIGISFIVIAVITNCAKVHKFETVLPPEKKSLKKYHKIIIENPKPGEFIHDIMENALRQKLTELNLQLTNSKMDLNNLMSDLKNYKFNPKMESISQSKLAYLKFEVNSNINIDRSRNSYPVSLVSCNYLKKKDPCHETGTGSISKGTQKLIVNLNGSFKLIDSDGKEIIPPGELQRLFSISGRSIESQLGFIINGCNELASEFTSVFIPHKKIIETEIMKGGDDIAISLIDHLAYKSAIKRLDQILQRNKEAEETADLYNLGLAFEAIQDISAASEYYNKAILTDPDNKIILQAMKRVNKFEDL